MVKKYRAFLSYKVQVTRVFLFSSRRDGSSSTSIKRGLSKFYILATKPYRRILFIRLHVRFSSLSLRSFVYLMFYGALGGFGIGVVVRNIAIERQGHPRKLVGLRFVTLPRYFQFLANTLTLYLTGINFGWGINFFMEGYHFKAVYAYISKLRRSVLFCRMGFFYNLLLCFPRHIKFSWRKRSFFIRGSNFTEFLGVCFYLRMVRNLFPYKIKGFIYDNYFVNKTIYEKDIFPLKKGKKDKQR